MFRVVEADQPMKALAPLQEQSLWTFLVYEDGELIAAWGVVAGIAGDIARVWGRVFREPKARRELAMLTRRWRTWLLSLYTTLAALVEDDNMRWVRSLGFAPDPEQPGLVVLRRG